MTRYLDQAQAEADGFRIEHERDRARFALYRGEDLVGEAHYSLLGDSDIDFDHTVVDPALRGTGLSSILAQRALTDDIVSDRAIRASCSFIEGYLEKHPELARG